MRFRFLLISLLLICVVTGALLQLQTLLAAHVAAGRGVGSDLLATSGVTLAAGVASASALAAALPRARPSGVAPGLPTSATGVPRRAGPDAGRGGAEKQPGRTEPSANLLQASLFPREPPTEGCSGEHKPGQLAAFKATATSYCSGRIRCVSRKLDYPETFCEAEGVSLDMSLFRQFLRQEPVPVSSNIDEYYLEEAPDGMFFADCAFDAPWELFNWGGARTLRRAFVQRPEPSGCALQPEPTVMLSRVYGKHNLWHASEDLMHMHESRELFGWQHARIVVLDAPANLTARELVRPYHPLYEHVFAPGLGYLAAHELLGNVSAPCVTFAKTYWQVHGGVSAFQRSVGQEPGPCRNSPLMTGLADAVLSTLPPVALVPGRTLGVVRGKHTVRKVVSPEWDAYVADRAGSANHTFVDFATLGILEQIQLVRSAETLVGIHGAALTHGLWMQPGARVVEVAQDFRCFCYGNVAAWAGVGYLKIAEAQLMASAEANGL